MESRRELLCQGFLRKSPPELKMEKNYKWRKRHFKLWSDKTLEYYKNDHEPRPLKEPLDLGSCVAVLPSNESFKKYIKKDYAWMFSLVMPGRQYHFAARTEGEMITWKREISKLCNFSLEIRNDGTNDAIDGITTHSRTPSVSSQGQISTSSTSSKSSPSQWRVNNIEQHTQDRLFSEKERRTSQGRFQNIAAAATSITAKGLNLDTTTSFSLDDNYDILRSPDRKFQEEPNYDVPPSTVHLNYDVLPPTNHLYKGRSVSLKQASTSSKKVETGGYVDMKPKEDDYLEYENENTHEGERFEKQFLSLPWMNINQQQKSTGVKSTWNVSKNPTRTISSENGFHHQQPIDLNDIIHDQIPNMIDKTVKPISEPPKVNRDKKPAPKVDRHKKPSIKMEGNYDYLSSNSNGMLQNNTNDDIESTDIYYNMHGQQGNNVQEYKDYFNLKKSPSSPHTKQPQSICFDVHGNKLTVGNLAELNLPIDYTSEPLPPSPSDSPSSPSSPYENSNDLFMNTISKEASNLEYENVDTSPEKDDKSLTYSEVTTIWTDYPPPISTSSVGEQAGTTGTHYVFVDVPKSNGLKMSKRSMEIGLADNG